MLHLVIPGLLALSAAILSFSDLLAPYALTAWPVMLGSGLLAVALFGWRRGMCGIQEQLPRLLALLTLLAAAITQGIGANDLPSGLLPLHALPAQMLIYLVIGGLAAFVLTWFLLARPAGASGGAALAAAGLYSSVILFRVSAVPEVGYAFCVLAGFALLALISLSDLEQQISKREAILWVWVCAFLLALGVAVVLSPVRNQSLFYTLHLLVLIGLAGLLAWQLKCHPEWDRAAWLIFSLGAGVPVTLAVIKALSIVNEFGLTAGLAYRLHPSEMGGANLIARSILVAAPLGAALWYNAQNTPRWKGGLRLAIFVMQVLILAVIFYARSYEGFFAWLVAWLVFGVLTGWKSIGGYWQRVAAKTSFRLVHIGAAVLLVAAILYVGIQVGYRINPYSFSGRFAHWAGALNAWRHHPVFGGGPDNDYLYAQNAGGLTLVGDAQGFVDDPLYVITYRFGLLRVHAHNLLLETAAFSGLFGLLTFGGLLASILWLGWKTWKQAGPRLKTLAAACIAGIAGELAWGMLDVIRETPPLFSFPVWALVGLLLAMHHCSLPERERSTSQRYSLPRSWLVGVGLAAALLIVLLPAAMANRYGTGFQAFQEQRWEDAVIAFRTATQLNPGSAQYFWMLSKAELETGQWEQAETDLSKAVSLKQGYSPYLTQAGFLAWRNGDLQAAEAYFIAAIANDPLESWTYGANAHLGLLQVAQGRPDEALQFFAKTLEYHPELATAPYWVKVQRPDGRLQVVLAPDYNLQAQDDGLRVRLAAHLGMAGIASQHLSQTLDAGKSIQFSNVLDTLHANYLTAQNQGEPNAHLILAAEAEAARLTGLYERAETAYLAYQELRPESVFGYQDLAQVYAQQNRLEEAQRWLEQAVEVSPKNIETLQRLALMQLRRQDAQEAAGTIARLTPLAEANSFQFRFFDVDLMQTLLQFYRAEQDAEKTRQILEWLVSIQATPEDFLALAQEAQNQNQPEQATEQCWQAYQALAKSWVRPHDSRLDQAASCIAQSGATDEQVERQAGEHGTHLTQSLLLGHIARQRGEYEQAREKYARATKQRSDEGAPHYYLGEVFLALNQPEEAEREYTLAGSLDEHEPLPMLALGRFHENNGDLEGATQAFEAAVARAPSLADAQLALANIYLKQQRNEEAARHLAILQQIHAEDQPAPQISLVTQLAGAELADTVTQGFIKGSLCEINASQQLSVFMHPVSWAKYTIQIPERPEGKDLWLTFNVGMLPGSWDQAGDGVNFTISIMAAGNEQTIYTRYLDPKHHPDDRKWEPARINLNEYAGQAVTLILKTDGGEAGNLEFDWACWGAPGIAVLEAP